MLALSCLLISCLFYNREFTVIIFKVQKVLIVMWEHVCSNDFPWLAIYLMMSIFSVGCVLRNSRYEEKCFNNIFNITINIFCQTSSGSFCCTSSLPLQSEVFIAAHVLLQAAGEICLNNLLFPRMPAIS